MSDREPWVLPPDGTSEAREQAQAEQSPVAEERLPAFAPQPFPEPAQHRWRRAAEVALFLGAIVLLWAGAAVWRLGAAPFYTKGEPREGLVVREMTHGGGWILPLRNGTELPSKPPLFHWLAALASLAAGGVTEATLRLPSALLSLAGVLAVFFAGVKWWNARAGFYAALVLLSSFEWARAATNARVDMTLTVGLEAAFLGLIAFWRNSRPSALLLLYFGMAWATLGKGPVGIALPALFALALFALDFSRDAWQQGRYREVFPWAKLRDLRPVRGLFFVLLVAGTWYLLALWQGGYAFFRKQVLAENVFTFLDDADFGGGHRHGPLYLPAQLLLGFLPWSVLLPLTFSQLWQSRRELRRSDVRVPLLAWVVVVFSFYEAAASKRGVYLLALYPALALLVGQAWEAWEKATLTKAHYPRVLGFVSGVVAVLFAVAAIIFAWLRFGPGSAFFTERLSAAVGGAVDVAALLRRIPFLEAVGALLAAASSFWLARRWFVATHPARGLLALFVASWVAIVGARAVFLPAYAQEVTLRDFMHEARAYTGAAPVYFFRTFDYQAVYYSFGRIPVYEGPIDENSPRYLLVRSAASQIDSELLQQFYRPVKRKTISDRGTPQLLLLEHKGTGSAPNETSG